MLETQCSSMRELHQIHSQMIKTGLAKDPIAISRLLTFTTTAAPSADLDYARRLFNRTRHPTLFMWNTLIRAFSGSSNPSLAISLFREMLLSPTQPNGLTFPSLFKAYTHLGLSTNDGSQLHAMVLKLGLASDPFIHNSMLSMYACCGELAVASQLFDRCLGFDVVACNAMLLGLAKMGFIDESRHLFDEMPERTVVSWSSMISGYVRNRRNKEAFDLFHQMQRERVKPNEHIMVSLLAACSSLGALEHGKWIHSYIEENYGLAINPIMMTAIVDMYCKCGSIEEALEAFEIAPVKSLSSWNSMILGLATHGRGEQAIRLFRRLQYSTPGLRPDYVSFISILTACSHSGMIEEAFEYFKLMVKTYSIEPGIEHYGCLVDALGRAGLIEEARNLIARMPMEPDSIIWGSLLSACRIHRHVDIGNEAAGKVLELDPCDSGSYVISSNTYAIADDIDGATKLRWLMKEKRLRKEMGCSVIELEGEVHEFVASGVMHKSATEIFQALNSLLLNIRDAAEVNSDESLHDSQTNSIDEVP
ncbi:Pentatricopeptide repeat-containing protein [Apostasia shenzhenica]|uniref:Pentatricopeptide repeat-containing protein n=1 Tax=Apostasia shenzhenica TaxID=1088818 RepID=A0A2I0BDL8_9ASPA|nr:Pentatricopeptide repeat-containing protein [Apostasia shenzhenica]